MLESASWIEALLHRRGCDDGSWLYYAWEASIRIILRLTPGGKLSLLLRQFIPWIMLVSGGPFLYLWWTVATSELMMLG